MSESRANTKQKALQINQDRTVYGTFAEIGAGQEVARYFFQAGGASSTVAKSMSAYDMIFSDEIYGPEKTGRYVCESRLQKMLEYEYNLLVQRLEKSRDPTAFFVLADTIATKKTGLGRGWMGIKFQPVPSQPPSTVNIHIRLLDNDYVKQQTAVGIVGVNLLYGCSRFHHDPVKLIQSLMDELTSDRLQIDMIRFSGPAFEKVDNRLISLELVQSYMTDAIMFTPSGRITQPAEALYNKGVIALRGSFRPFTRRNLDMIEQTAAQVKETSPHVDFVVTTEISMNNLLADNLFDQEDFLARVDCLAAMGYHVIISYYQEYYRLAHFFQRYTDLPKVFLLGAQHLGQIFEERYYQNLDGGILEAMGKLFRQRGQILVYPDLQNEDMVTCDKIVIPGNLKHLYNHLRSNHFIDDVTSFDKSCLNIHSSEVLKQIQQQQAGWQERVPEKIADLITKLRLFQ